MATGVESSPSSSPSPPEAVVPGGIALEFPASDDAAALSSSSPPRIPRRLQKRLLEGDNSKTPTAEEIEAKLRDADLRRQQFYEKLSTKARPKPRSPTHTVSHEEDLGQRLEAKLQAAQQKRLSILEKAQLRLARLDELRQAAKIGVEMRFKRERERLGTQVELRVQQAEANRMLILKARKQRGATLKERTSQSLLRRMARESKYRERVRNAIHQKRASAERKRLGLLEAEKKKACARVSQVQQVAQSVLYQREVERRKMRDQLEDRLQRAKRQRAEYLRQRGRQQNSVRVNFHKMQKQADVLSRKLARCWRKFLRSRRTTLELAKDYDALKINESCVKSIPFEQLALLIESPATLWTAKAILDRLESRYRVSKAVGDSSISLDNIDHLLKRVATPRKRTTPRTSTRTREPKNVGPVREGVRGTAKQSRYPVRVVLCAYMILGHPDAVFSGHGEREVSLAKSAEEFIREFELLIKIILDGPVQSSDEESDSMPPKRCNFRAQLAAFDRAWCSYLNCFVVWKVKDAQSLVEDLVRAACQLELSMIQKCKLTPEGDNGDLTHDMKAIQKQVVEDQKLLREKIQHLCGEAGIERMEHALSETRSKYYDSKENGSPVGSPVMNVLHPNATSSSSGASLATSGGATSTAEGVERPSRVVRSLFKDNSSAPKAFGSSSSNQSHSMLGTSDEKVGTENEQIVNEFLHEQHRGFVDTFSSAIKDENSIKEKIKQSMEVAFWDGVIESLSQDVPNYSRVLQLVREARDEISEIAPLSWKQEIAEAIDLDILSQVLNSGNLDIDYFGKILEYALGTLQKLCSPAQEEEMKLMHQKLLKELAEVWQTKSKNSHAVGMVKGLRFVLEQVQVLKQEISKARIRMMEPLLKGPAGLEYLRQSFSSRYGSHTNAHASLPLTMQWLSSTSSCKDQEWEEHTDSLAALITQDSSSQGFLPSTALRTGGSLQVKLDGSAMPSVPVGVVGKTQPECSGERVDLLVRLGLLKLVNGVSGLTKGALPETFMLNLSRLRGVQAQIQKIIHSYLPSNSPDGKNCRQHVDNVGIEEIVNIISGFSQDGDKAVTSEKLQSRKLIMGRMLAKSLQSGDPIFEKVSRVVYLALRGIVLGGSGPRGRKLAETALQQVGAVMLTDKVVVAAEELIVAASVSVSIHGPWYVNLCDNVRY
ncbi:hypothetical protein Tsubulata_033615 [Turnera subulata]|uniref:T-complex protein 11 n=1 Tax=Turnera subulata TaxID=218843 RepID=A0A9Q0F381_9ROSI|nr:hypothetical protein Tsubulata_033615 [Turnera subulata]